jgi:cytochrome c peroxidase
MFSVKHGVIGVTICFLSACGGGESSPSSNNIALDATLTTKQLVGKKLFFDTNLSEPTGQSCASCHDPATGFSDPNKTIPTSQGVHSDRFGSRNSPTIAYAAFSPEFYYDKIINQFLGGQFADGRAATLKEQAKAPFLNVLEMANPDKTTVVTKVARSDYAALFQQVYGTEVFYNIETAYDNVGDAIAAFEKTSFFSPFSSKYDAYLNGKAILNDVELTGLRIFEGKCAICHPSRPANGIPSLFTGFSYENLGLPRNEKNPFLNLPIQFNKNGNNFKDLGLGGIDHLNNSAQYGKFKVPTLRNVALTAPYMHNGIFNTLKEVIDFYNTRDIDSKWGTPEVPETMNREKLGNFKLTENDINALVAFLMTLTDGYQP